MLGKRKSRQDIATIKKVCTVCIGVVLACVVPALIKAHYLKASIKVMFRAGLLHMHTLKQTANTVAQIHGHPYAHALLT